MLLVLMKPLGTLICGIPAESPPRERERPDNPNLKPTTRPSVKLSGWRNGGLERKGRLLYSDSISAPI